MDINFNFNVRQNVHLSTELKEFIMSQLSDLTTETKAALADMKARIAEDFDALRAKIEQGTITQQELDDFRSSVIGEIKAVDPDPSNPPAEPA